MRVAILQNRKLLRRWMGDRVAIAIHDTIKDLGYAVEMFNRRIPTTGFDCVIAITPRSLIPGPKKIPTIVYNNDPVYLGPSIRFERELRRVARTNPEDLLGVIDHLDENKNAFNSMGVRNRVVARLGYHDAFLLDRTAGSGTEIGFFGVNPCGYRRRILLDSLYERFDVASFPGRTNHDQEAKERIPTKSEFSRCVNAKVWLHINKGYHRANYYMADVLHELRVIQIGLINKLCVLSENFSGYSPPGLLSGEQFITASFEDIPEAAEELLADNELRESISKLGYEWVRDSYRMIDHWRPVMDEVSSWL